MKKDGSSNEIKSDDSLQKMFKDRNKVHEQVRQDTYRLISAGDWQSIDYYYKVRCDLIHRKASASITDIDLDNYRKVVIKVLEKLFNLNLSF
mgnify:CR=1 FL=1